jgi:hypothetical protein
LYIYGCADDEQYNKATDPYQMTGLYQQITGGPYNVTANPSGIAWRTTSRLLKVRRYDKEKTDALKLPDTIDGAAFSSEQGDCIYVLWAKTKGDNENTSATYTFPSSVTKIEWYTWDYKANSTSGNKLNLTGSPIFVQVH